MAGLMSRFNVVPQPHGTATFDDGTVDHVTALGPDGLVVQRPLAATPEEVRLRTIAALRRELDGVEHRLAHLDDEPLPWVDVPSAEAVNRTRTGLEDLASFIRAEIARLDESTVDAVDASPKRKRLKRRA